MINEFPKIFSLGTVYIKDILNEEVEVSEKIDGSQLSFAKINGNLYMRSKGAMLYADNPQKMFAPAISPTSNRSKTNFPKGSEEEQNIKQWLWNEFKGNILRTSTHGLPEWYKEKLLKESNNEN